MRSRMDNNDLPSSPLTRLRRPEKHRESRYLVHLPIQINSRIQEDVNAESTDNTHHTIQLER